MYQQQPGKGGKSDTGTGTGTRTGTRTGTATASSSQEGPHPPSKQKTSQPPTPMMVQPGQVVWMPVPPPGSLGKHCPPGLEYLTMIDHLFVKQKVDLLEVVTGFESANKYVLYNNLGQQVYYAFENSECCSRQCFSSNRGFTIHILDNAQREVIRVIRPFKCCVAWGCTLNCCACPGSCCSSDVFIESPPGVLVGAVQQQTSCCTPNYLILDANKEPVLRIEGPPWCCSCCEPVFEVKALKSDATVGEIKNVWAGALKEFFTNATNFGINFPMDLSVQTKATLIGATFLIDFMAFEEGVGLVDILL